MGHGFTDKHQPSLEHKQRAKIASTITSTSSSSQAVVLASRGSSRGSSGHHKLCHSNYVRGVVECKDCLKPRVLFSLTSPSRMILAAEDGASEPTPAAVAECRAYAAQQLEAAENSELFLCGMQPFDADHPFYGVLVTREGLLCSDHMEVEYYTHNKQKASWFQPDLCAYCT